MVSAAKGDFSSDGESPLMGRHRRRAQKERSERRPVDGGGDAAGTAAVAVAAARGS